MGEDIPILLIILQMPVLSSVFFNLKLRVFWSENIPTRGDNRSKRFLQANTQN